MFYLWEEEEVVACTLGENRKGKERENAGELLREKVRSEEEDHSSSHGFVQCKKVLHYSRLGLDGLING